MKCSVAVPPQQHDCGVCRITLPSPCDVSTWKFTLASDGLEYLASTFPLESLPFAASPTAVFLQHSFDDAGRHEYVAMAEAVQALQVVGQLSDFSSARLRVYNEDEVKDISIASAVASGLPVIILSSIPGQAAAGGAATPPRPNGLPVGMGGGSSGRGGGAAAADASVEMVSAEEEEALCPTSSGKTWSRNYSVVADLSLSKLQRVVLCDEATLQRGVGAHGIGLFNHLSAIVNCHEDESAWREGKYSTGTARPEIIWQPVHKLLREAQGAEVVRIMHGIQERFWDASQRGAVAVHCLAGVHRAPTVVCCQWLYRYYIKGHKHLPCDVEEIYRRMRAVRASVEPLSYIKITRLYEGWLQAQEKLAA